MSAIRHDSAAARFIIDALREPLVLIDVGCSGGLDPIWGAFGDKVLAYAFDPSVAEIERLAQAETRSGVHYVPAFIAAPADHPVRAKAEGPPFYRRDPSNRLAWWRTLHLREAREAAATPAAAADAFIVKSVVQLDRPLSEPFKLHTPPAEPPADGDAVAARMEANEWFKTVLADRERPITLPAFLKAHGVSSVDFIKIDCDGPDFEILSSLDGVLRDAQVVGLSLEVNFIGGAAPGHHSFHNTDRFMRRAGFELADLTVRRYASAALPFLYTDPYPNYNRNLGGRPYQGDALYARDFGWVDTHDLAAEHSDDKLLKLAAIMVLFGRVDQAAELLIMFRSRLESRVDIDRALDLLSADVQALQAPLFDGAEAPLSYADHMGMFEADDPAFYDGVRRLEAAPTAAMSMQAPVQGPQDAEARLAAVLGSTSWRITAPIRAVLSRLKRR